MQERQTWPLTVQGFRFPLCCFLLDREILRMFWNDEGVPQLHPQPTLRYLYFLQSEQARLIGEQGFPVLSALLNFEIAQATHKYVPASDLLDADIGVALDGHPVEVVDHLVEELDAVLAANVDHLVEMVDDLLEELDAVPAAGVDHVVEEVEVHPGGEDHVVENVEELDAELAAGVGHVVEEVEVAAVADQVEEDKALSGGEDHVVENVEAAAAAVPEEKELTAAVLAAGVDHVVEEVEVAAVDNRVEEDKALSGGEDNVKENVEAAAAAVPEEKELAVAADEPAGAAVAEQDIAASPLLFDEKSPDFENAWPLPSKRR